MPGRFLLSGLPSSLWCAALCASASHLFIAALSPAVRAERGAARSGGRKAGSGPEPRRHSPQPPPGRAASPGCGAGGWHACSVCLANTPDIACWGRPAAGGPSLLLWLAGITQPQSPLAVPGSYTVII